jgi:polar amino acid transport system substrate-binding protein
VKDARRLALVALAAVLVGCGGSSSDVLARIKARGELRWGADAQGGAPYVFQDPKNPEKLVGFEVELADAIAAKLGVKARFVQSEYKTLLDLLARGDDIDLAINGIEATEDKRRICDLSRLYYVAEERLAVRTNAGGSGERAKEAWRPGSLDELKGKKAGTLPATLADRLLVAAGAEVHEYDTGLETVYGDLVLGRIDAVLIDEPTALYYGKIDGVTILDKSFGEVKYAIAMPFGQNELHQAVDDAIDKLRQDGKLKEIYQRWGIWNPETDQLLKSEGPGWQSWSEVKQETLRERLPRYPGYLWIMIRDGVRMTLGVSLAAFALAVLLGVVLALSRRYGPWPLRLLAAVYIEVFRGTPLLVQLFFIYFGLPEIGISLPPLVAGILGLGLNYAAAEAENYRAGLESVPAGQLEASWALGLSTWQAVRFVVVPQAVRVAIPPATNDFIALLKDSSLISVITLNELLRTAQNLASATRDQKGMYALCAIVYLALGLPFARFARWVEQRMGAHLRRTEA